MQPKSENAQRIAWPQGAGPVRYEKGHDSHTQVPCIEGASKSNDVQAQLENGGNIAVRFLTRL